QSVEQNSSKQCQAKHQGKRQRHRAVKNQDWHDVDVGVIHPIKRRNKEFRNLRDQDKNKQNKKENHFRPVTTNTSSRCDSSTAGVSCACPSSSRTRKVFTTPISKPEGNTPPTPEV